MRKKTISRSAASQTAVKRIGTGKAISWSIAQTSKYDFPVWTVMVSTGTEIHEVKVDAEKNEVID